MINKRLERLTINFQSLSLNKALRIDVAIGHKTGGATQYMQRAKLAWLPPPESGTDTMYVKKADIEGLIGIDISTIHYLSFMFIAKEDGVAVDYAEVEIQLPAVPLVKDAIAVLHNLIKLGYIDRGALNGVLIPLNEEVKHSKSRRMFIYTDVDIPPCSVYGAASDGKRPGLLHDQTPGDAVVGFLSKHQKAGGKKYASTTQWTQNTYVRKSKSFKYVERGIN